MIGWMFFFMGVYYKDSCGFLLGLFLIITSLACIRTQFMVTQKQYISSMVPHHSMAVHMSRKLLEKNNTISGFLENLIFSQSKEIEYMNQHENDIPDATTIVIDS